MTHLVWNDPIIFCINFFTLLLTTFAVLIISAIYYWPLALLLAIVFPIYVWLTALTSRNWQTHQDVINHHIIPGCQGGVDAYGFLNHGFLESHNRFGITTSAIEYSLSANQCIPG